MHKPDRQVAGTSRPALVGKKSARCPTTFRRRYRPQERPRRINQAADDDTIGRSIKLYAQSIVDVAVVTILNVRHCILADSVETHIIIIRFDKDGKKEPNLKCLKQIIVICPDNKYDRFFLTQRRRLGLGQDTTINVPRYNKNIPNEYCLYMF